MSRRNRRERHHPPPMRPREIAAPSTDGVWQPNERGTGATITSGPASGTVGWLELIGLVRWAVLGPGGVSAYGFVEVPLDRPAEQAVPAAMIVARTLVESVIGAYAAGLELG